MVDYEPYVLTLFQTDAEWTRKRSKEGDPFALARQVIDQGCIKYRLGVSERFERIEKTWKLPDVLNEKLDECLYKPQHFSIFGMADQLSMVLFDDFDPCHAIAAEIETGLADLAIAMCPKIESTRLETAKGLKRTKGLETAKELLQSEPSETPLFAFTKFKLDGAGTLAGGIEFQEKVFQRMADNISNAVEISMRDEASIFRFALLELLGSEEVGLLMLSNNYTACMSAVFSARSIQYRDLPGFEEIDFAKLFGRGGVSVAFNHVFSGSRTTLGVRCGESSPIGDVDKVIGNISGASRIRVPAGHIMNALSDFQSIANVSSLVPQDQGKQFVTVGSEDLVLDFGQQDYSTAGRIVQTKEALTYVANLIAKMQSSPNDKAWRNVTEMITDLQVPVPRKVLEACLAEDGHSANVLTILNNIRLNPLFELLKLRNITCTKGVPVVLRRILEHFYQTVGLRLTDPLSWESILDSIDILRVFYDFLTDVKPSELFNRFRIMSNQDVDEIAEIVAALDSVISHRVAKPFSANSDMALDYRGGLQQLVYASSAMTMFGSILWQAFFPVKGCQEKERVGLATRIQIGPGLNVKYYVNVNRPLAVIKADVPHILDIATYPDFFHEVAHLIFDSIKQNTWKPHSLSYRSDELLGEIFAHFLTLRLVFKSDHGLFGVHQINSFFTQIYGDGSTEDEQDDDLLFSLSAVFDQVFVAMAFDDWVGSGFKNRPDLSDDAFEACLKKFARYFKDRNDRWNSFSKVMVSFFVKRFRRTRKDFQKHSSRFECSINIAVSTIEKMFRENEELASEFGEMCSVLRNYVAFLNQNNVANWQVKENDQMPFFDVKNNCDFFLHREVMGDRKTQVYFPKDRLPPAFFLVNVGAGGSTTRYCVIPKARAERMSLQCASIKKMWNLAAKLRRDKFAELATQFFPSDSDTDTEAK